MQRMKAFTATLLLSLQLSLLTGNFHNSPKFRRPLNYKDTAWNVSEIVRMEKPDWVRSMQSSTNNNKQVMKKKRSGWKRWAEPAAVTICAGTAVYFIYSTRGK